MTYTVYTIRHINPVITDCYIGYTKNFYARKSYHKSITTNKAHESRGLYAYLADNGGWDQFICHPLESAETKEKAQKLEEKWRLQCGSPLNINKSGGVSKDRKKYFRQWKDEHPGYDHKMYEKRKEKIARYNAHRALWTFLMKREDLF